MASAVVAAGAGGADAMATQAKKVTIAIPDDAPPGTLLCVPVGNGEEQVKVRVPKGMGPGSTIFLTRPDGAEDWDVAVGKVVPLQPDADQDIAQEDMGGNAALGEDEDYNRKQQELAQRFANTDEQSLLAQRYAEQERLRQQEEQQHLQQEQQRQRPQQQQEQQRQRPQQQQRQHINNKSAKALSRAQCWPSGYAKPRAPSMRTPCSSGAAARQPTG